MKKDDISFCSSLIGKPWVSGAAGPDAFDCWGLLQHVFKIRRCVKLDPFEGLEQTGPAGVRHKTKEEETSGRWALIIYPVHFCVVAMSRGRHIEHVGLWLDEAGGGILHSYKGAGVVFQSMVTIRNSGIQNFTFYQLRL